MLTASQINFERYFEPVFQPVSFELNSGEMLLGTGAYQPALGAALMLAANIICVNIAAVATFVVLGVRPAAYWEAQRARRATRRLNSDG